MLALVHSCTQTLQHRLELSGGVSETVFPAVEAWLQESSDHWNAFRQIAGRKRMSRYRSVLDFVLCEVCPEERRACFDFYAERGPQLRELRSERRIRFLESKLLAFLAIAYEAHCQQRSLSWATAVACVDEICAAA